MEYRTLFVQWLHEAGELSLSEAQERMKAWQAEIGLRLFPRDASLRHVDPMIGYHMEKAVLDLSDGEDAVVECDIASLDPTQRAVLLEWWEGDDGEWGEGEYAVLDSIVWKSVGQAQEKASA